MFQIDYVNNGIQSTLPAPPPASALSTPGYFQDGNPATGQLASIVPAEWFNAVMMELINAIEAAGITPQHGVYNQLAQAISTVGRSIAQVPLLAINDTVLTAAQAATAILQLEGPLVANVNVDFPAGHAGVWIVQNQTTGGTQVNGVNVPYTVTLRIAGGGGVPISQGASNWFWSDGVNVYAGWSDFANILPTVRAAGEQFSGVATLAAPGAVPNSAAGALMQLQVAGAYPIPQSAYFQPGSVLTLQAFAAGVALQASGTDHFIAGTTQATSIPMGIGDGATLVAQVGGWSVQAGNFQLQNSSGFNAMLSAAISAALPAVGVTNSLPLHTQSSTNLLLQSQNFASAPWAQGGAWALPTTNQLLQSQNMASAPWSNTGVSFAVLTNQLLNSQALNNWTLTGATVTTGVADPWGGATASTVTGAATTTYISETLASVSVGANYTASVYLRAGTASASTVAIYNSTLSAELAYININWSGGVPTAGAGVGFSNLVISNQGGGWYRVSGTFSTGSFSAISLLLYPDALNTSRTTQMWGAQLEYGSTLSPYNATAGVTNLDPTGNYMAVTVMETAGTSQHVFSQTVSKPALSQTFTFSISLKAAAVTTAAILISNAAGTSFAGYGNISLSAGTLGSGATGGVGWTLVNGSVINQGNGWYRYSVTVVTDATAAIVAQVFVNNTTAFVGTAGAGIQAFGAQLEFGATASAYSPTTTASNFIAAPDGTNTAARLVMQPANGFHYIDQSVNLTAGQFTTFSIYAQAAQLSQVAFQFSGAAFPLAPSAFYTLTGSGSASSSSVAGAAPSLQITPLAGGWYRLSMTAPATGSGAGLVQIVCAVGGTTYLQGDGVSGVNIWGAQWELGQITGPYVATTTVPASGAGLPVTNLLTNSGQMQTGWTLNALTVAANAMLAPDGSLTATQLIESTANSPHNILQSVATPPLPTATYTFSCWVKAGARSNAVLLLESTGSGYYAEYSFNLSSGASSCVGALGVQSYSATAQYAGNGWWRCSVSAVGFPASDTAILGAIYPNQGGSYTGDGVSGVYVWGGQLEQNGQYVGPGCYVPTTSGPASGASYQLKAGQICYLNSTNGPYSVALESCPSPGDTIQFVDVGMCCATNNIGLQRNGSMLMGQNQLDIAWNFYSASFKMVYTIEKGWVFE